MEGLNGYYVLKKEYDAKYTRSYRITFYQDLYYFTQLQLLGAYVDGIEHTIFTQAPKECQQQLNLLIAEFDGSLRFYGSIGFVLFLRTKDISKIEECVSNLVQGYIGHEDVYVPSIDSLEPYALNAISNIKEFVLSPDLETPCVGSSNSLVTLLLPCVLYSNHTSKVILSEERLERAMSMFIAADFESYKDSITCIDVIAKNLSIERKDLRCILEATLIGVMLQNRQVNYSECKTYGTFIKKVGDDWCCYNN